MNNAGCAATRIPLRTGIFVWLGSCAGLLIANYHFALADELVIEPEAVLISRGFGAGPRRAAEQADAGGNLKNVGRKRTTVDIEFDAQIAGVGNPGDLIAGIEHDYLRNESNEYGAFGHCVFGAASRNGFKNPATTSVRLMLPFVFTVRTITHPAREVSRAGTDSDAGRDRVVREGKTARYAPLHFV